MSDASGSENRHEQSWRHFKSCRRWDRALEAARDWLAVDPTHPMAHGGAGEALLRLGRASEAEAHFRESLAADPHDHYAMRGLAFTMVRLGRVDEALHVVRQALVSSPDEPDNWMILAMICYSCGDRDGMLEFSARARALAPEDANVVNLHAMAKTGVLQLEALRSGLALDPSNPSLHHNLGLHHLTHTKDLGQAEECFRAALRLEPNHRPTQKELRKILALRDPVFAVLAYPGRLFQGLGSFRLRHPGNPIVFILSFDLLLALVISLNVLVGPVAMAYQHLAEREWLPADHAGATAGAGKITGRTVRRILLVVAMLLAYWGLIWAFVVYHKVVILPLVGFNCAVLIVAFVRAMIRNRRFQRTYERIRRESAAMRLQANRERVVAAHRNRKS